MNLCHEEKISSTKVTSVFEMEQQAGEVETEQDSGQQKLLLQVSVY